MSFSPHEPLPALRTAIDVFPVDSDWQRLLLVRDRLEPSAPALVLTEHQVRVASLLDGTRSASAIAASALLRFGLQVTDQDVLGFAERLDEAGLLDSPRFASLLDERRLEFRAQPERPAVHAGGAYPGQPAELEAFLRNLYHHSDGPGGPPGQRRGEPARGLIAPHIDLHRGGPTYAWTYRALAEREPADLYVLLGTCHTSMQTPLAATRKPYATPLGALPVDHGFLDALEAAYPGDLYEDELSHRAEHSLEFQAVYLRHLALAGGRAGAAVASILCGSLQEFVPNGARPAECDAVAAAERALRQALEARGGRICLVAGADLAHVGPQFGDPHPVSRQALKEIERADREMLDVICRGDAEGFYEQVMRDGDARKICGLAPIYYLLSLLGPGRGELLRYSQWADERGTGTVTYAGVIFDA